MGFENAKKILDFLNSNPGYSKAWDTFIAAHPDFKNPNGQAGAGGTAGGILDYFGGQWDTNAGRKPGDSHSGSVQEFFSNITNNKPNAGEPANFVADPVGKTTGGAPGTTNNQMQPNDVAKKIFEWATNFKSTKNTAPTRQDWQDAWGNVGGQTYDWGKAQHIAGVDVTQNLDDFYSRVGGLVTKADQEGGGLGGSLGSTYAQPTNLAKQQFDWTKDYQIARAAAQDAQFNKNFVEMQRQNNLANAVQLAGLTGAYNGQPTLAMQQFNQNQANFERQFGLTLDQFNFQKDQFAKQYGLQEAQVTGMFQGNPTLAMQQFTQSKDQFAQNFKLNEAQLTGRYNGELTLEGQQTAYNAARAGNPLQYLQTIQGGAPVNYAGMPQPGQQQMGVPGTRTTQPVGGPVVMGEANYQAEQAQQDVGGPYMTRQDSYSQLPQAPQNIQNIMAGAPLPAANVTAPGLRLAGAQAQANETPYQKAARMESYALAGGNEEDILNAENKIKQNLGGGLQAASYAPGMRWR